LLIVIEIRRLNVPIDAGLTADEPDSKEKPTTQPYGWTVLQVFHHLPPPPEKPKIATTTMGGVATTIMITPAAGAPTRSTTFMGGGGTTPPGSAPPSPAPGSLSARSAFKSLTDSKREKKSSRHKYKGNNGQSSSSADTEPLSEKAKAAQAKRDAEQKKEADRQAVKAAAIAAKLAAEEERKRRQVPFITEPHRVRSGFYQLPLIKGEVNIELLERLRTKANPWGLIKQGITLRTVTLIDVSISKTVLFISTLTDILNII
jgi:hypothetical protein